MYGYADLQGQEFNIIMLRIPKQMYSRFLPFQVLFLLQHYATTVGSERQIV